MQNKACSFLIFLLTFFTQIHGEDRNHVLYLMHSGQIHKAIEQYEIFYDQTGRHDYELIEQMGLILLDQGHRAKDPEILLLTLFGAGISLNEKALYILENGLQCHEPMLQLVALNFLSRYQNDDADASIIRALGSNFLLIRLEALLHLAEIKHPKAFGQAESLMTKVDDELHVIFPRIFAMLGDNDSIKILRRMLVHQNEKVRIEAILSAAESGRDDLLPYIRRLASQVDAAHLEAAIVAIGEMRDEVSVPRLHELAASSNDFIRLAAWKALYQLDRTDIREKITQAARQGYVFAIAMLGDIAGSEDLLYALMQSYNIQVRINATLALMERNDKRCCEGLREILIHDYRDLAFVRVFSPGKGLTAWRAIPSSQQNLENPMIGEASLRLREKILTKLVHINKKSFNEVANLIFQTQQNDLIPHLVLILEDIEESEILKQYHQKAGAPLIRNYCNLALYRMKEAGPYAHLLREWVREQQCIDLMKFRPLLTRDQSITESSYLLTPNERARILIEAYESFARSQDEEGIEVLLGAIKCGHPKNRYTLAGLLMRAVL